MKTYFEYKISYDKLEENGMNKKVTESYLVEAMSYAEAENQFIEYITPYVTGNEYEIKDIKRSNYAELFLTDEDAADKYFACKLEFITINEKTAQEKKTKMDYLVQAANLKDAMKKLDAAMSNSMADYNAVCVKETALLDVFQHNEKVA